MIKICIFANFPQSRTESQENQDRPAVGKETMARAFSPPFSATYFWGADPKQGHSILLQRQRRALSQPGATPQVHPIPPCQGLKGPDDHCRLRKRGSPPKDPSSNGPSTRPCRQTNRSAGQGKLSVGQNIWPVRQNGLSVRHSTVPERQGTQSRGQSTRPDGQSTLPDRQSTLPNSFQPNMADFRPDLADFRPITRILGWIPRIRGKS